MCTSACKTRASTGARAGTQEKCTEGESAGRSRRRSRLLSSISSAPPVLDEGEPEVSEGEADGLVKAFDDHEQSVFATAWSAADAWIFASLSLDGKAVINHVPPAEKYKILL